MDILQPVSDTLWIPEGFHAMRFIPESLSDYRDYAFFFVHTIQQRKMVDVRYKYDRVPLNRGVLRKFFYSDAVYDKIRKFLIDTGAIICNEKYLVGMVSKRYTLGDQFVNKRLVRYQVTNKGLLKKMKTKCRKINAPLRIHKQLYYNLVRLRIDLKEAAKLLGNPPHPIDYHLIERIDLLEFFFEVCPYGRVHTNLSNMRGDLRRFLSVDGKKLVNIDIRNSQPLIFSLLIFEAEKLLPATPISPEIPTLNYLATIEKPLHAYEDVSVYLDLVQRGKFYEYLMTAGGVPESDRPQFKERFFGRIFFCKNKPKFAEAVIFERLFPNVYHLICKLKEKNYAALAHKLQRAESDLMIRGIAERCMNELPHTWIGTIHDSIMCLPESVDAIQAIILEEFAKKGLTPSLKLERY